MDKLKIGVALMKKHHFWILTGTVILLGLIGWFMAASNLWAQYKEGKEKIEKRFRDLGKINADERENQSWIDDLEAETKKLKIKVATAWDQVYTKQKTKVLEWPPFLGDDKATLDRLGPTANIPPRICENYLNYVTTEFPRLLQIVDARDDRKAAKGFQAESRAAAVGAGEHDYKVIWDSTNQKDIAGKFDWTETPDSQRVREAQEDLWVYQALLKIISNLNDVATGNYNAKVKEIQSLLIGKAAAEEFQIGMTEGRLEKPSGAPAVASSNMGAAVRPPVDRYINELPLLTAGAASPAVGGEPAPAAGAVPTEFKGMAVVMKLVMDQRQISRLLVECANSPLPVEVRQFRLQARSGKAKADLQLSSASSGSGGGGDKDPSSYDMEVTVEGIIYIFNPPDLTKLGNVAATETGDARPAAEPPTADASGAPRAAAAPAAAGGAAGAGEPAKAGDAKVDSKPDAAVEEADAEKPGEMTEEPPESN